MCCGVASFVQSMSVSVSVSAFSERASVGTWERLPSCTSVAFLGAGRGSSSVGDEDSEANELTGTSSGGVVVLDENASCSWLAAGSSASADITGSSGGGGTSTSKRGSSATLERLSWSSTKDASWTLDLSAMLHFSELAAMRWSMQSARSSSTVVGKPSDASSGTATPSLCSVSWPGKQTIMYWQACGHVQVMHSPALTRTPSPCFTMCFSLWRNNSTMPEITNTYSSNSGTW
mmetsp:Transcript_83182/g.214278  ORF Transcript_83182/g.214278 Transcript_83182/m.214278 type:complete len:233 (+) Transcript_83182:1878-2576(+)